MEPHELSVDDHGQLWIPTALQERLGLRPGMILVVEEGGNNGVRLRPGSPQSILVDKQGILVVLAQPVGDLEVAVRREREGRVRSLLERIGQRGLCSTRRYW